MALFQYIAFEDDGKKIKGFLDADNFECAKNDLVNKNLIIVDLKKINQNSFKSKLSPKDLLSITQDLARLLEASLPLYDALLALEEKYRSQKKIHPILLDLCDKVKDGKSLSFALSDYSDSFDILYRSMIANAENVGTLPKTLLELSDLLTKQMSLKRKLVSLLLYPSILSCFCILVVTVLLFFVLPTLFELFEQRSNLHPMTSFVLNVSKLANDNKLFVMIFALLLIVGIIFTLVSKTMKKYVFLIFLKIPFINTLFVKASVMRFSMSFSSLLLGGVPFVKALSLSKDVLNHPELEKDIEIAVLKVLEGKSLSQELKKSKFPPLVSRMLSIAEEGADMPFILKNISKIYEYELEKSLNFTMTIIQPALLLLLGVMVGFIVLSVLLPLTDVSSFIAD